MCLTGAVVASWPLTQEVAGLAGLSPFTVMINIFVTETQLFTGEEVRKQGIRHCFDAHGRCHQKSKPCIIRYARGE